VPIYVTGLADLQRAFSKLERDTRLGLRHGLRDVAEPVRRDAERLAITQIRRIRFRSSRGPKWEKMRIGVNRNMVYVAPVQRGVKSKGRIRRYARPKFADVLLDYAMEPALHQNEAEVERSLQLVLDHAIDTFNRGN